MYSPTYTSLFSILYPFDRRCDYIITFVLFPNTEGVSPLRYHLIPTSIVCEDSPHQGFPADSDLSPRLSTFLTVNHFKKAFLSAYRIQKDSFCLSTAFTLVLVSSLRCSSFGSSSLPSNFKEIYALHFCNTGQWSTRHTYHIIQSLCDCYQSFFIQWFRTRNHFQVWK